MGKKKPTAILSFHLEATGGGRGGGAQKVHGGQARAGLAVGDPDRVPAGEPGNKAWERSAPAAPSSDPRPAADVYSLFSCLDSDQLVLSDVPQRRPAGTSSRTDRTEPEYFVASAVTSLCCLPGQDFPGILLRPTCCGPEGGWFYWDATGERVSRQQQDVFDLIPGPGTPQGQPT